MAATMKNMSPTIYNFKIYMIKVENIELRLIFRKFYETRWFENQVLNDGEGKRDRNNPQQALNLAVSLFH